MCARSGRALAAELAATVAWAWLLPCLRHRGAEADDSSTQCYRVEDRELSSAGSVLLANCVAVTRAAADAYLERGSFLPTEQGSRFAECVGLSERPFEEAFREGSEGQLCSGCPESCTLALVLQALSLESVGGVAECSQTLLLLTLAFRILDGVEVEFIPEASAVLVNLVDKRRAQCADLRRRELERQSLPGFNGGGGAAAGASAAPGRPPRGARPGPPGALGPEGAPPGPGRPGHDAVTSIGRVAILLAATPSMLHVYQPFINLWRCYALRHGLDFILETDDTEVSWPHHRAPNWMRWFAAFRQLRFYAALLVVDPDQFVVPECWNVSIPGVLGAWAGAGASGGARDAAWPSAPDVATRDFGRPQTLNNGVVLVRSSPRGRFFLEQLLAKAAWMQTIEKDQGAFDETILEVLGLEAVARGEEGYDSECAQFVFPNARGNHEVALYALCWWRVSERLAGPFGSDTATFK